jgi:hypothetical protein
MELSTDHATDDCHSRCESTGDAISLAPVHRLEHRCCVSPAPLALLSHM